MDKGLENGNEILKLKFEIRELQGLFITEADKEQRRKILSMIYRRERRVKELERENCKLAHEQLKKLFKKEEV